jgi:hypothetical protein
MLLKLKKIRSNFLEVLGGCSFARAMIVYAQETAHANRGCQICLDVPL